VGDAIDKFCHVEASTTAKLAIVASILALNNSVLICLLYTLKATEANRKRGPGTREKVRSKKN
jgi:hypothetical protein